MNLQARLDTLEAADLIRRQSADEAGYEFKHTLTQEAAYDTLLLKSRRELHARVAVALEQLYGADLDDQAGLLARHYGEAGDLARAAQYAIRAGNVALRRFDYPGARQQYRSALDALRQLPETDERRRERIDLIVSFIDAAFSSGNDDEKWALADEAESLARQLPGPDNTTGDPVLLLRASLVRVQIHIARNELEQGFLLSQQVLAQPESVLGRLSEPRLLALPFALIGTVMVFLGRFKEVQPFLDKAIQLAQATPQRWESWASILNLGLARAHQGDVAGGLEFINGVLNRSEAEGNTYAAMQGYGIRSGAYLAIRDARKMLQDATTAFDLAERLGERLHMCATMGLAAIAASRVGDHPQAAERYARHTAMVRELGGHPFLADWVAAGAAEIDLNAGRIQAALDQAQQAAALGQAIDSLMAEGWARRVWGETLARLGNASGADEQFAKSLELSTNGGAVLEAVWTEQSWGKSLQARGDVTGAEVHLQMAKDVLERAGLAG